MRLSLIGSGPFYISKHLVPTHPPNVPHFYDHILDKCKFSYFCSSTAPRYQTSFCRYLKFCGVARGEGCQFINLCRYTIYFPAINPKVSIEVFLFSAFSLFSVLFHFKSKYELWSSWERETLGQFEECFHFLTFLQFPGWLAQGDEITRAIIYFLLFDLFYLFVLSRLVVTRRENTRPTFLLFDLFYLLFAF